MPTPPTAIPALALLALVCCIAAGCRREDPPVVWQDAPAAAPPPATSTTPPVATAPVAAPPDTLPDRSAPEQLPAEIPVYADATVVQVVATERGAYAMLRTAALTDTVTAFYNARLAAEGWTAQFALTNAGSAISSFVRDSRSLAVVLSRPQQETLISLTLSDILTPANPAPATPEPRPAP